MLTPAQMVPDAWRGCLIDPAAEWRRPQLRPLLPAAGALVESTWFRYGRPTAQQVGPSCTGHAVGGAFEMLLLRYVDRNLFAPGEYIAREAIWRRGRELFWGGKMNAGLYPEQACAAAVDLGILPPGTKLDPIGETLQDASFYLQTMPLVGAWVVHDGWFRPDGNGCIDHAPAPDRAIGAHAMAIGGLERQAPREGEETWFLDSPQSWGADFGWHGWVCMTWAEHCQCAAAGPWRFTFPDGLDAVRAWRGWENHVERRVA